MDDGTAIHYSAVAARHARVRVRRHPVGVVDQVVDNYREHILDGIVIETDNRELRFVDAPEVGRTAERGVTLSIDAAAVEEPAASRERRRDFQADVRTGRLGKLLGRAGNAISRHKGGTERPCQTSREWSSRCQLRQRTSR